MSSTGRKISKNGVMVEPWDRDKSTLMWNPVVRYFIGGPLDGRALEGPDNREWEAGPMAATTDYWYDGWILYRSLGHKDENGWSLYMLDDSELLRRARARYVVGEIELEEFDQVIGWALAVERELEMAVLT